VEAEAVTAVRERLATEDAWFVVAEDEQQVVGMACGVDGRADDGAGPVIPELCHLSLVYVAPARWGERIGGKIMDAALAEARDRGYRRIQLWTHEENERAQRLYTSHGFEPSGRTIRDERGELIGHWSRAL
jgi:GNAT superfamily N-acetyltransferase